MKKNIFYLIDNQLFIIHYFLLLIELFFISNLL